MKIKILVFLIACFTLFGAIKNDAKAPTFTLMNQDSEMVDLESFKGKKVILEWTNHDCPFVKRHYDTENMQNLQTNSKHSQKNTKKNKKVQNIYKKLQMFPKFDKKSSKKCKKT